MMRGRWVLLAVVLGGSPWNIAHGDIVQLAPSKDNTLFESTTGNLSGAIGDIFVGRTNHLETLDLRRGLIAFNVAGSVPAGSTITAASLGMRVTKKASTDSLSRPMTLHRLSVDWGEGTSNVGGNGAGVAATNGDATWRHRFFPGTNWTTPGGDFVATASATTNVGGVGNYTWSSAGMVADVQAWLNTPANNFGWLIKGDESANPTGRVLASGENITTSFWPQLTLTFTAPLPPVLGDANGDRRVDAADYNIWRQNYGLAGGVAAGDFNSSGFVTGADYTVWANNFGTVASPAAPVPEPSTLLLALIGTGVAAQLRLQRVSQFKLRGRIRYLSSSTASLREASEHSRLVAGSAVAV